MSLPPPPEDDSLPPSPETPSGFPASAMPPVQPAQPTQPGQPVQPGQPGQPVQPGFSPVESANTSAVPAQPPLSPSPQPTPGAQPYPAQEMPGGAMPPYAQYQQYGTPTKTTENPLKPLFDFKFKRFITIPLLGVIYAVGLIFAGVSALLTWGMLFLRAATIGSATEVIGAFLLIIPIGLGLFLGVLLWRVTLESVAALIRVAENSTKILEATEKIEAAHERG